MDNSEEKTQVYNKKPEGFSPKVEVAAVYVNVDDKILLLQIASHKPEQGAWGVPAGKLEVGEMPLHAARRELFEETGIQIPSEDLLMPLGVLYVRKPALDYVYHLFGLNLSTRPSIYLSAEHSAYTWVTRQEAEVLPLMNGALHALNAYYRTILK